MYEIVLAGGWMMVPLLLMSIAVVAITAERYWTLNAQKIIPAALLTKIWDWLQHGQVDSKKIKAVHDSSPLGQVLAAGLSNTRHSRAVMIESMEVAASRVQHDLERYLSALSAMANIAPLMGLLGTVIGTIKIFSAIMLEGGTGNPGALAGGISEALIATATGLIVAIPASLASRYFYRVVDGYMINIQQDAMKLVDALYSDRKVKGEKSNAEH
ncbi:MAG: MotA/TolQ/ExbB proton channel family protein [Pseudomonadales bacterium]